MGIVANIRALFGRAPAVRHYGVPVDYVGVEGLSVEKLYRTQPALKTVVDYLARNIAQLPLKVYTTGPDGSRRRDRECTAARLLARPSPDTTQYELVRDTVSDLKLYDFALWVVGRDSSSDSGWQIRHIPARWVIQGEGGGFSYERFVFADGRGQRVEVDAESCVVFHGYSPGDPREGSSAVRALRETIREQTEAQRFRRSTWDNAMRITGYIKRPPTVEPWTEPDRNRFAEGLRSAWGRNGSKAGGTPVLEDGMEFHSVEFGTKEKDWAQGVQLAREEVAAMFHVNPAMIWHAQGQTYASAKDNARALYADTLAPDLRFIETRATARLAEIIGESGWFCEFDLQAKLQGSFEEQASSLQSSVGAPWMTRNEARARMNLPPVEDGDELITPLNVLEGGLASPNDTDPTQQRYNGAQRVLLVGADSPAGKSAEPGELRFKSRPDEDVVERMRQTLEGFYERQGRSVVSAIAATPQGRLLPGEDDHGHPLWWDGDRWIRELSVDLARDCELQIVSAARRSIEKLGGELTAEQERAISDLASDLCRKRSAMINERILQRALDDVRGALSEDGASARDAAQAFRDAFDGLVSSRSTRNAESLATAFANYGTEEGAKRSGYRCDKVWVTGSSHPRATHAAMAGERVEVGKRFSNGARWPGDTNLSAKETCNCKCRIEIVKDWRTGEQAWKRPGDMRSRAEIERVTSVATAKVQSRAYEDSMRIIFGDQWEVACDSARKALEHRDHTLFEDLYAINLDTGHRVAVTDSPAPQEVVPSKGMQSSIDKWIAEEQRFAMLHNHPESGIPSMADIRALRDRGAEFGVIVCHDGGLYRYMIVGEPVVGKTIDNDDLFGFNRSTNRVLTFIDLPAVLRVGHQQMAHYPPHFRPHLVAPLYPVEVDVPVQV